jgi:hypothetical protein
LEDDLPISGAISKFIFAYLFFPLLQMEVWVRKVGSEFFVFISKYYLLNLILIYGYQKEIVNA